MLYIKKMRPPVYVRQELTRLKSTVEWRKLADDDVKGRREFFDQVPKEILRAPLLEDQHHLCAYCMCRLSDLDKVKIEHYKPLSLGKEYALDYDNLLAVCMGGECSEPEAGRRILCCDASKSNTELHVINPMDYECMSHIKYDRQGMIYFQSPKEWDEERKRAAKDDINGILQLNGKLDSSDKLIQDTATHLVKNRADAYRRYQDLMDRWSKHEKLTAAHLRGLIHKLEAKPERDAFVGVIIFFLKRKLHTLEHSST